MSYKMPRTPIDYSRTIIYKLVCNDLKIKECYVGATTDFTKRKYGHKGHCNNEKTKNYNINVYQFIRANGGWDNWSMIMIEEYPCKNKLESGMRERYWIESLKAELNMEIPNRTDAEYYQDNKEKITEKHKEYRKENKEYLAEYKKEYRKKNKEHISEKNKEYVEKNKEQIKEYLKKNAEIISEKQAIYRKNNKEKIAKRKAEYYQEQKAKLML